MNNLLEQDNMNAEGYCNKCGLPLGIEGVCSSCAAKVLEDIRRRLKDMHTCQICGQPKYHSRLHGYRCRNEEHNNVWNDNIYQQKRESLSPDEFRRLYFGDWIEPEADDE